MKIERITPTHQRVTNNHRTADIVEPTPHVFRITINGKTQILKTVKNIEGVSTDIIDSL